MQNYIQDLLSVPTRESALAFLKYMFDHPKAVHLLTADEKQVVTNAINVALAGHMPPGTLASVH